MRRVYFDASALIKRYSQEAGTNLMNEVFRLPSQMTCSTLGIVGVVATLVRKRNDGRLSPTLFAQAVDKLKAEVIDHEEFAVASVDDALLLAALDLITKHNLNATDAVILRSVLNLRQIIEDAGDQLMLWVCDKRLARAARDEDIAVFDPEEETLDRLHQLLDVAES